MKLYWQIKPLIFSSHQNPDGPKITNYAIIFDLSRHAKSALITTKGFMSSTKVATKVFLPLRSISANKYLRSLQLTCDSPKTSGFFFSQRSLLVFQSKVSPQLLTWCLPSKTQSFAFFLKLKTRLGNHGYCTSLWELDGPELPESSFSLNNLGLQNLYFFNSTYFIFSHQSVNQNFYT